MGGWDYDAVVERWAPRVTREIQRAAESSSNEAEFRRHVANVLEQFATENNIPLRLKEEYTVAEGRVDAAYNRLIVEYENPGWLKPKNTHRNNDHSIQQVKSYIEGVARAERLKTHRMAGVVLDGHYVIFVRHFLQTWVIEEPAPVNEHAVERLLKLLISLSSGAALIPENLIEDFGPKLLAQRVTRAFYSALERSDDRLVNALFRQWQTFFSQVTGYEEGSMRVREKKELQDFVKGMGLDPKTVDLPKFFFTVHTYYALLIKLIAWLVVSRYAFRVGVPFGNLATLPTEELHKKLADMERGGIFKEFGIRNFLEGDFFSWYLRIWNDELDKAVRLILNKLNEYDPGTLEVSPEQSRDLLKKIYHYLMPRELRHDLGEYYTPDWLAQRLLNMMEGGRFQGDPRKRILDPACGSGTFLVLAIKAIREWWQEQGYSAGIGEPRLLELILQNVVGIDLNPLAVITARTNYLLALGGLLEHRRGEIDIPVYLADSILTPSRGSELFTQNYQVRTTIGPFEVPREFATKERIDALAALLDESVESGIAPQAFLQRVRSIPGLTEREFSAAQETLSKLYERLQELHKDGLNGVWARIIKNAFAPLFIGQFDYVIGNPPWVNWESLPDAYRRDTAPLWDKHKLFPHKGYEAILGKAKDDISILMTYVALDSYLKDKGRLGFVITQSVFKTAGAGQGFRRFQLGDGTPIRVVHVDDMVELQPFEGASNRTSVVILEKGRPTKYPVPYTLWKKTAKGKSIGYDSDLADVESMVARRELQAEPVDASDPTSPWLTARPKALKAIRKVLGRSDYEAHAGAYTGGANGVYWVEIIGKRPDGLVVVNNITEGAKRKVDQVQAALEPDLLYPLLRCRDVQRWQAIPSAHILITHKPGMKLKAIPEEEMQHRYPKAYAYLQRFQKELLQRVALWRYFAKEVTKSQRLSAAEESSLGQHVRYIGERKRRGKKAHVYQVLDAPFYSMFDVGDYTFAPWKVVWTRIAQIEAAVVGTADGKAVVPQETVTLVECASPNEAHYVAALVNSSPFQFAAVSYSQEGGKSMGSMHVLEHIRIPRYDPSNPVHRRLAELSEAAHAAAQQKDTAELQRIEAEIDQQAARLWGLTDEELEEIKRSLDELS